MVQRDLKRSPLQRDICSEKASVAMAFALLAEVEFGFRCSEASDPEWTNIKCAVRPLRELTGDFAQHTGELETVPRESRNDRDVGLIR